MIICIPTISRRCHLVSVYFLATTCASEIGSDDQNTYTTQHTQTSHESIINLNGYVFLFQSTISFAVPFSQKRNTIKRRIGLLHQVNIKWLQIKRKTARKTILLRLKRSRTCVLYRMKPASDMINAQLMSYLCSE